MNRDIARIEYKKQESGIRLIACAKKKKRYHLGENL